MAASKMLITSLLLAISASPVVEARAPYCLPGNPCFPSPPVLNAFNTSIGGRLIKIDPYGAPCYKATYDADKCKELATVKRSPEWRISQPGENYYIQSHSTEEKNEGTNLTAGCKISCSSIYQL